MSNPEDNIGKNIVSETREGEEIASGIIVGIHYTKAFSKEEYAYQVREANGMVIHWYMDVMRHRRMGKVVTVCSSLI